MQEDVRFSVLRLLKGNPEMPQREIAKTVGISVGSTHYLLKGFVDKGLVKIGNFTASAKKRRYVYALTPKGIALCASMAREFLERKIHEYETLKEEIETLKKEIELEPILLFCKQK